MLLLVLVLVSVFLTSSLELLLLFFLRSHERHIFC